MLEKLNEIVFTFNGNDYFYEGNFGVCVNSVIGYTPWSFQNRSRIFDYILRISMFDVLAHPQSSISDIHIGLLLVKTFFRETVWTINLSTSYPIWKFLLILFINKIFKLLQSLLQNCGGMFI